MHRVAQYTLGLVGLLAMGCDGGGASAADLEKGEQVYDATCAACHGADGGGEAESGFPDATDLTVVMPQFSDEQLVTIMLEGSGTMPAQGITADDADKVVLFLRETFEE